MAKYIYFIIFLLLLENIICETYQSKCEEVPANEQSECKDYLQDEEKEEDYYCCFVEFKKGETLTKFCDLIHKDASDDYKIDLEQQGKKEVVVACKAYYLYLSLLSLIIIII